MDTKPDITAPIKVAVRIRNNPASEGAGRAIHILTPETVSIQNKEFALDAIYPSSANNPEVYTKSVSPAVKSWLEGYNACILTYGETTAGKTFTVSGPTSTEPSAAYNSLPNSSFDFIGPNRGILPRVAEETVAYMKSKDPEKLNISVKASYFEIHQDMIKDLLLPVGIKKNMAEKLRIRPDVDGISQTSVHVQGLLEKEMVDLEDYLDLLAVGSAQRSVKEAGNLESASHSHTVFTLTLDQVTVPKHDNEKVVVVGASRTRKVSKLYVIDLAGSEKLDCPRTGKEAASINASLGALAKVVDALSGKVSQVPYKESKLTQFLTDPLGGNSQTVLIACVNPSDKHTNESLNTLKFAEKVRKIQNVARVNFDQATRKIQRLEGEIKRLRGMLGKEEQLHTSTQTLPTVADKISNFFGGLGQRKKAAGVSDDPFEEYSVILKKQHPELNKVVKASRGGKPSGNLDEETRAEKKDGLGALGRKSSSPSEIGKGSNSSHRPSVVRLPPLMASREPSTAALPFDTTTSKKVTVRSINTPPSHAPVPGEFKDAFV